MPKGIYLRTAYHNTINSLGHKGLRQSLFTCLKRNKALKGRTRPTLEIERASKALKTHYQNNPNKFAGVNNPFYGKSHSAKTIAYLSNKRRLLWKDPSYRTSQVASIMKGWVTRPNKAELALLELLETNHLAQWQYVGDGQLIIGGKCPDFTNCNGHKWLIELFGDYFHRNENPQIRIDYFRYYGYHTLVIWEHELKEPNKIIDKIDGFLLDCLIEEIEHD